MSVDQWVTASSDDEIDLREVFAVLRRRWRWVVGGGLVGMALAAGIVSSKQQEPLLGKARLVIDIGRSPCYLMKRKL